MVRGRGWGGGQRWENGAGYFVKNIEESCKHIFTIIYFAEIQEHLIGYLVEIRQIWKNKYFLENSGFGMILAITWPLYHNFV